MSKQQCPQCQPEVRTRLSVFRLHWFAFKYAVSFLHKVNMLKTDQGELNHLLVRINYIRSRSINIESIFFNWMWNYFTLPGVDIYNFHTMELLLIADWNQPSTFWHNLFASNKKLNCTKGNIGDLRKTLLLNDANHHWYGWIFYQPEIYIYL